MKPEDVREALCQAFNNYWQRTAEISINGKLKRKDRCSSLHFSEDEIDQLRGVICCGDDPISITGSLETYIPTESNEGKKSIYLGFVISSREYSCEKTNEDKPKIEIRNVSFVEKMYNFR